MPALELRDLTVDGKVVERGFRIFPPLTRYAAAAHAPKSFAVARSVQVIAHAPCHALKAHNPGAGAPGPAEKENS
jgi:hypothetical protein